MQGNIFANEFSSLETTATVHVHSTAIAMMCLIY